MSSASSKSAEPSISRHETDQHAVPHDLRLQPGGTVDVPQCLPAVPERHADPEAVRRRAGDVGDESVGAQGVSDPGGFGLLHGQECAERSWQSAGSQPWMPDVSGVVSRIVTMVPAALSRPRERGRGQLDVGLVVPEVEADPDPSGPAGDARAGRRQRRGQRAVRVGQRDDRPALRRQPSRSSSASARPASCARTRCGSIRRTAPSRAPPRSRPARPERRRTAARREASSICGP